MTLISFSKMKNHFALNSISQLLFNCLDGCLDRQLFNHPDSHLDQQLFNHQLGGLQVWSIFYKHPR